MNLRPAGDSGLDQEPTIPEGHLSLEHIDVLRTLGPGPDDAHLAAEDVPKLRNLVPAGSPEDATDSRDARVASGGIHGHSGLGVRDHRPKLHHLKWLAALTASSLAVEDLAAADSEREADQQDERQEDEQRRACDDRVEGALPSCRVPHSPDVKDAREPRGRHHAGHAMKCPLVEVGPVEDGDRGYAAVEEPVHDRCTTPLV